MKPCSACLAELPKEAYSKKQWQAKQIRRCKGCIQVGREPSPPKEDTAAVVHEGNDGGDWERTWPKKKRALIRNDEPVGAIDEEALFRQPPPTEDCAVCLLPLPLTTAEMMYQPCCGKTICQACIFGMVRSGSVATLCPFCRAEAAQGREAVMKRIEDRIEAGDAQAVHLVGMHHKEGSSYWPVSPEKALEMWFRAAKMGWMESHMVIGDAYDGGYGFLPNDMPKAKYHHALAAIHGNIMSRYNLGVIAANSGDRVLANRHWSIAAKQGNETSLDRVKEGYVEGYVSKKQYAEVLRAFSESVESMASNDRHMITRDEPLIAPELRNRPILVGGTLEEEKKKSERRRQQNNNASEPSPEDLARFFATMMGSVTGTSVSETHLEDEVGELFDTIKAGSLAKVRKILKRRPDLVTKTGGFGFSALEVAAASTLQNNLAIVKLLIEHGADMNRPDPHFGQLPLHRACEQGAANVVSFFLDNGMDANAKDGTGQCCLCIAAEHGRIDVCRLLLARGARKSLDVRYKGMTPRQWAEKCRNFECAGIL
ncbi:hypothetical protein ACHAXT_008911 [Thalassiosira profunda]